jgi:large subunit ribosomal protein L25
LKKGGAVNLVLHTVEVMAPADNIPESVTVDLAGLDFQDSVHVSDLQLPEGCKAIGVAANLTVVTIVPPTVMAEEAPAAATAAAPAATPAPAADSKAAAPAKGAAATPAAAAVKPAAKK